MLSQSPQTEVERQPCAGDDIIEEWWLVGKETPSAGEGGEDFFFFFFDRELFHCQTSFIRT